jgi:mRNA-degrading endonuclease RelE of RelBE toxin-antitoxin system
MRCTVAETYEYHKRAKRLLSDTERDAVIDYLSEHPKEGVLIRGTGGVRKLRWSHNNRGKSGGFRIIYSRVSQFAKLVPWLYRLREVNSRCGGLGGEPRFSP